MLLAGSYERFLWGYSYGELSKSPTDKVELKKQLCLPAHQGPVKCVDAAGHFVVTGGADDQMHIYDLRGNKDLGFLMNPSEGAVTCVQLYTPPGHTNPTNLLSGSNDGTIHVWSAGGGWEHMKPLRGHRSTVHSLSVHPTGTLALSVAHDQHLRLWDLVKGRCSYQTKLDAEADIVRFGSLGTDYAIAAGGKVAVHSVGGQIVATLAHSRRVHTLERTEHLVLTGSEDGTLRVWDLRAQGGHRCSLEALKAHGNRIRGIALPGLADPCAASLVHVASASSDGRIRLWDLRALGGEESAEGKFVGEAVTNARLTSLVVSQTESVRTRYSKAMVVGLGGAVAEEAGAKGGKQEKKQGQAAPSAAAARPAGDKSKPSSSGKGAPASNAAAVAAGAAGKQQQPKPAGKAAPAPKGGAKAKPPVEDFEVVRPDEEEEGGSGEDGSDGGSDDDLEGSSGDEGAADDAPTPRGSGRPSGPGKGPALGGGKRALAPAGPREGKTERAAVWAPRGSGFRDLKEERRANKRKDERRRKLEARKKARNAD